MYLPIYHPITVPYMTNTVATDSPLCKYRLKKKKIKMRNSKVFHKAKASKTKF